MKRSLVVAAVVALLPLSVALAEDDHRHGAGMLERWDSNSDGVVTRAEVEQGAAERARKMFDSLDADGDGTLTKAEMEQSRAEKHSAMREKAEERFKTADTNADGSLSKEEAEKALPHVARHFEHLDANKDGAVSADELRSMRKSRKSRGSE
jgi:Ca2+-binding EF-hand superfamily protein